MILSRSEFNLFWSNKLNLWLVLSYFLAGILAIGLGNISLQSELESYRVSDLHYQSDLSHYQQQLKQGKLEPGYMGYYLLNPVKLSANAWSTLFRGERDETSNHTRIRLLGLQSQVNGAASGNIQAQQYGTFDLAFLWLYLMPLVIAAMSINTLADEKSSGRWPMLLSQVPSGIRLILNKLAIPTLMMSLTNLGLLIAATQLTPVVIDLDWVLLFTQILLYQLCWLSVCTWIIFLNKEASFNYLVFITVWLVFTFFLPGLSYLYQVQHQKAGEDAAIVFEQRQYMNDSWDKDKQADFDAYLAAFPQWKETKASASDFDWRWYYSQQHMSDIVVKDKVERREDKQLTSYQQGQNFAWFTPVLTLKYSLDRLADTDMLTNVSFNQQIRHYHQTLRDYFWHFYFNDKKLNAADINAIPSFDYHRESGSNPLTALLKLLLIASVFILLTLVQMRRFEK